MDKDGHSIEEISSEIGRGHVCIKNFLLNPGEYGNRYRGSQSTLNYETRKKIYDLAVEEKKNCK